MTRALHLGLLLFGALALPALAAAEPPQGAPSSRSSAETLQLTAQAQRSLELNEQGVLALKKRNFPVAESLFRQALDTDSLNATAAFNLASTLLANKKEREALPLLKEYASHFPGDASFQARLGDAYFGLQDPKNATSHYERAYAIDPQYPQLAAKLGTLYSLLNELERATGMYEAAVKLHPKDAQSLSNLSSLYLADGQPSMAVATAKRAVQLQPKPETFVTLGSAYEELKDPKSALSAYRRASDLGYKDPALREAIAQLEKKTEGES